jgi:hypothetical protein
MSTEAERYREQVIRHQEVNPRRSVVMIRRSEA